MDFDDFADQVEARLIATASWTDIQVSDFNRQMDMRDTGMAIRI